MPAHQLMPSAPAQNMIRSPYYNLDEDDRKGGWGSATKAAIGKMEYHMPTAACLATLASCALDPASFSPTMDDNAIKRAVQHFVLRVCYSCTIADATVQRLHVKPKAGQATFSPRGAVRPMTARVLEICLKNSILESHLSSHFGTLKGAYKPQDRIAVMKEFEHLGLGEVKEARRKPGGQSRSMEFHRFPLSPAVSAVLRQLDVVECLWPVAQPCVSSAALPPMNDAGKRGRRAAAGADEDVDALAEEEEEEEEVRGRGPGNGPVRPSKAAGKKRSAALPDVSAEPRAKPVKCVVLLI